MTIIAGTTGSIHFHLESESLTVQDPDETSNFKTVECAHIVKVNQ